VLQLAHIPVICWTIVITSGASPAKTYPMTAERMASFACSRPSWIAGGGEIDEAADAQEEGGERGQDAGNPEAQVIKDGLQIRGRGIGRTARQHEDKPHDDQGSPGDHKANPHSNLDGVVRPSLLRSPSGVCREKPASMGAQQDRWGAA